VLKRIKGERREQDVFISWDSKLSPSLPFLKTVFEYPPPEKSNKTPGGQGGMKQNLNLRDGLKLA
jgi:hypothetical protein